MHKWNELSESTQKALKLRHLNEQQFDLTIPAFRPAGGYPGQELDGRGRPIYYSPYDPNQPGGGVDPNNPPEPRPLRVRQGPDPSILDGSIPGTKNPPQGVPPVTPMDPNNPEGGGFSPQPGGMYYTMPDGTVVYGTWRGGTFYQWGTWSPPNGPWRWNPGKF